ncbi:MAG TPA: hypothetical protein VHN11_09255 [Xanthobacteraceae bacterium]|jgi:hypothetical protein|nr:hypothetical protein [Xanthobacteraceae bacterium]
MRLSFLLLSAVLISVTRVVVVPADASKSGETLIVYGAPRLHLVDSPQAICKRKSMPNIETCAADQISRIRSTALVVAHLPYEEQLNRFASVDDQATEVGHLVIDGVRNLFAQAKEVLTRPEGRRS